MAELDRSSILSGIAAFWKEHGAQFTLMWDQMTVKERELLLKHAPYLPESSGSLKDTDDANEYDMGLVYLCPELNFEHLSSPTTLPNLFQSRSENTVSIDDDLAVIRTLVKANIIQVEDKLNYVELGTGQQFVFDKGQATLIEIAQHDKELEEGVIIEGDVYAAAVSRQATILNTLNVFIDYFLTTLELKGEGGMCSAMNRVCGECGRTDEPLKACRCHKVFYCDRDCQKKSWKEHSKVCGK